MECRCWGLRGTGEPGIFAAMSIYERIKGVFDAPSRRRDKDYSKEIPHQAVLGVVLLFRDHLDPDMSGYMAHYQDAWMRDVVRDLGHLHHFFAGANPNEGFQAILRLLDKSSTTTVFLDFLEVSLRHQYAPNSDNDFVDAVNRVLEEYSSPYLLSRYARRVSVERDEYDAERHCIHFDAVPRAYLRHESAIQQQAIEPTLEIFSDPAYAIPAEDFRTALERQRNGDYDGCVTSCAAAVEGAIKVAAEKNRRWSRRVRGSGLDKLAQSFISESSLPDTMRTSFRPLSNWRNTNADAHGHDSKDETTESIARHFVVLAASLIVLVQSEVK